MNGWWGILEPPQPWFHPVHSRACQIMLSLNLAPNLTWYHAMSQFILCHWLVTSDFSQLNHNGIDSMIADVLLNIIFSPSGLICADV